MIDRPVIEHVVTVDEVEPGRFRAVLVADSATWTSSNFRKLDQRMRLEIGRRYHDNDSLSFDVRYLMNGDTRVSMVTRGSPSDEVSRTGPLGPLVMGSKALVLSPDHGRRGVEMIAWLRQRNHEDPDGRYLLRIIESHGNGVNGWCGTCLSEAPCNTIQQLVMHYITKLGAEIEHVPGPPG